MRTLRLAIAAALLVVLAAPAHAEKYRIGAWNIADLHHENGVPLRPDAQARDAEDFDRLKAFAAALNLDIAALQEIGSLRALERVFPPAEYHLIISPHYKPGDENKPAAERDIYTAFAVRKSKFPQAPNITSLEALGIVHIGFDRDGRTPSARPVREGLVLTLPAGDREVKLLDVHLKSSCHDEKLDPVDDTDTKGKPRPNRFDCRTAVAQAMILENWIEQQVELKHSVIVLGDFNRRLNLLDGAAGRQEEYWQLIDDGEPEGLDLRRGPFGKNTTCWPEKHKLHFEQHIEFIVFDSSLDPNIDATAIAKVGLPFQENAKYLGDAGKKLSDHCPIVAMLDLDQPIGAVLKQANDETPFVYSHAVQYQENAAEYRALARTIFGMAQDRVDEIAKQRPPGSWVVSVDADETVLDNLPFTKEGEEKVEGFSDERWDKWIQQGAAQPVPGALGFLSHVLSLGGKVAIVTNRLCNEAEVTRDNLQKLGFPANPENVCILVNPGNKEQREKLKCNIAEGVVEASQSAKPANDKDARWLAIQQGTATECWDGKSASVKTSWDRPHEIVLYVGDNVKDFPGMTQKGAVESPEIIADHFGTEWFLIPNAAYGSWVDDSPKRSN